MVWVVDRASNTIIDEISCGKGSCGIVVHPNGKIAYVTNAFDGTIAVFDTTTHKVIDTIVLETVDPNETNFPVPIVLHPAGINYMIDTFISHRLLNPKKMKNYQKIFVF